MLTKRLHQRETWCIDETTFIDNMLDLLFSDVKDMLVHDAQEWPTADDERKQLLNDLAALRATGCHVLVLLLLHGHWAQVMILPARAIYVSDPLARNDSKRAQLVVSHLKALLAIWFTNTDVIPNEQIKFYHTGLQVPQLLHHCSCFDYVVYDIVDLYVPNNLAKGKRARKGKQTGKEKGMGKG